MAFSSGCTLVKPARLFAHPRTAYESTYFEYGSILASLHIVEFGHALKESPGHRRMLERRKRVPVPRLWPHISKVRFEL
jgi:hypothetical protein